jgi:hypothetical protein
VTQLVGLRRRSRTSAAAAFEFRRLATGMRDQSRLIVRAGGSITARD